VTIAQMQINKAKPVSLDRVALFDDRSVASPSAHRATVDHLTFTVT